MPHRKNPAEDHNPFDAVGHARGTTTTTTTPSANVTTKKRKKASKATVRRVNSNLQSKHRKIERSDKRKSVANAKRRKALLAKQKAGRAKRKKRKRGSGPNDERLPRHEGA